VPNGEPSTRQWGSVATVWSGSVYDTLLRRNSQDLVERSWDAAMPCQAQNRFASDPGEVIGGGQVAEPN
jgi:hypothetical protein